LREYLFVGGLPEAVRVYAESGRLRDAFLVQDEVVQAYRADFGKYAPRVEGGTLDEVLTSVARTIGTQVVYSRLAAGPTQPTLKTAFNVLERAQVVQRVTSVKHVGLPLGSGAASRRFKAILVDLGLQHRLCGLSLDAEYAKADLLGIYEGALAEQFVGQELHAASDRGLFYWARDAKSSTAEVDYLLAREDSVVPIEVKSGPGGRLRSMHQLLKECPQCAPGVVLSTAPYAELPEQGLWFLPLYFAGSLARPATDT
jgi:predicted AAA+ superfamily ATPase